MAPEADRPTSTPSMTNLSRQLRPSFMILPSLISAFDQEPCVSRERKLERNIKRELPPQDRNTIYTPVWVMNFVFRHAPNSPDSAVRSIAGPLDAAKRRSVARRC